jgi:hypothetical protein
MNLKKIALSCFMASVFLLATGGNVFAGRFWQFNLADVKKGVRSKTVSICFVGTALTTNPDRVNQVLTYIKEWEYAANVKFDNLGTCAAPTTLANGNSSYAGDIRILIKNAGFTPGKIPGTGCKAFIEGGVYDGKNNGWGSWSNAPDDLETNRPCLYNLKLGDDPHNLWTPASAAAGTPPSTVPYLDHTLHEFGHALGFGHEHERSDVDKTACPTAGGGVSGGFLTPYDKLSVMHYQFLACGINGNYDNKGLSEWDKLSAHIMYPEDEKTAEFIGTTVVKVSSPIHLVSAWKARGANLNYVAKNFVWKLSGATVSTTPELNATASSTPKTMTLEFSYSDFLGRSYSYVGKIEVLSSKAYNAQIAAPAAAQLPLF